VPGIGTLGHFWLRYDTTPITLPSMHGKILTALHCERGAVHQDMLIDMVWEGHKQVAPATFRTHVSRMRNKIKEAGFDPGTLFTGIPVTGDRNAYQIAEHVQSDGDRALALGTAGAEALARRNVDQAVNLLREAAELWKPVTRRGQILAGVADLTFAIPFINELWEARKNALTKLAAAELRIGLDNKPAADLARLAADWPEDREIARLQVIALHSNGQTTAAAEICIRQAAACRDMGVDPKPFLDLHQAILSSTVEVRSLIPA
jgi:DNA-binding SARP family transcriptional activator